MLMIFSVLLIVLAVAWPLYWLLGHRITTTRSAKALNLAIYRERLDELKQDVQSGTLQPDQFNEAREELAAALLQDIKTSQSKLTTSSRRNLYLLAGLIVVLIAVSALAINQYLRSKIIFQDIELGSNTDQAQQAAMESRRIAEQLRHNIDNTSLWEQLGQKYLQMGRPDAAMQAFTQSANKGGSSVELVLSQIQVAAMAQQGNLDGEPAKLIARAMEMDPNNPRALFWSGMLLLQHNQFDQAIEVWERVRKVLPPDAPQQANINKLIEEVRIKKSQAGNNSPSNTAAAAPSMPAMPMANSAISANNTTASTTMPSSGSSARIEMTITLAPQFAKFTKPDTPVFIFARAVNGPSMPLAVLRKNVSDLPLNIALDDSGAMVSNSPTLSQFNAVKVVARVSISGDVMAQPGDLFGEVGPIDPHASPRVTLNVNQQVPGGNVRPVSPSSAAAPTASKPAAAGARLQVKIELDPALKAQANPDDTVFVFARAASGPPMPLAAVRKQVRDLPFSLTLDDSSAMSPQLTLSQFNAVKVVARISHSGTPTAQPGDLYGEIGPLNPHKAKPQTIRIKSKVP